VTTEAIAAPVAAPTIRTSTFLSRILAQPVAVICAGFLLIVILACAFAPWISGNPLAQDLTKVYAPPSPSNWFGADQFGRDIFTRILHGGQITLVGALEAVAVYTVLGMGFGLVAGSARGMADTVIMRACDLIQSIPGLVILLVVLAIFGQNETAAMVTLGVLTAPGLVRIVRGATLVVRAEPYVAAARVAGLSRLQILTRHVVPAVTGPALTQISLMAGVAILVESAIGFLGLGVAPPAPSWGNLISEAQRAIALAPWMLFPTGGVVALVTVALTLLGDSIRDSYAARSTRSGFQPSWHSMAASAERTGPAAKPSAEKQPLLRVRDLSIHLPGVTVVDKIGFDVMPGEAIGIVGESGCGKSITVTGMLRVLPPGSTVSGTALEFEGRDLLSLSEREMAKVRGAGIAYISQEPISGLDPVFTAGFQIAEAVRQHRKVSAREARAIALELLRQVRLPDPEEVAAKYPHQLSGGMAQRIAIARALAGQPKLLIADEPTTALDVTVQAEILDLLRDLRETTGMSMILVTHDWGVLADACDRAIVMYAGQVVETAPTAELVHRPAMPYTRALLQSMPANFEPGRPLPTIPGTVPPPNAWPKGCRFAARCTMAADACRTTAVPLVPVKEHGFSRCLFVPDVLALPPPMLTIN
jgi:peptide/nickel transport system permease protein